MNDIKTYLHFDREGNSFLKTQNPDNSVEGGVVVEFDESSMNGFGGYKYDFETQKVIGITNEELEQKQKVIDKENDKKIIKDNTLYEIVKIYPIYRQVNMVLDQVIKLSKKNKIEITEELVNFIKFRDEKVEELNKSISSID